MEYDVLHEKIEKTIQFYSKFNGKDFFKGEEHHSFYVRMIQEFNYYIFKNDDSGIKIFEQIKEYLSRKCIYFATFSFFEDKNNKYLTICHEFKIYIIIYEENQEQSFVKEILSILTRNVIHFIAPNKVAYEQFRALINTILLQKEHIKEDKDKFNHININNVIFPNEEEQENIEQEINEIQIRIEKKILHIPIFNISKYSLLAYMIRRFYFNTMFFENPSFFEYKSFIRDNCIQLREFKNNEITNLREISKGIFLIHDKITNQLFVQKIKNIYMSCEQFATERKLYERINEMNRFVKCFGYTKNKDEQIESIIIEFMSETTLQNYIMNNKNKSITDDEKYELSFQIIEELQILHSNNFIHVDLKPDNIFINHDHKIFIGDFNCSKFVELKTTQVMTKDIGSFIYSSPEILNLREYYFSTDIYSFGLVLFFIFKEEIPFSNLSDSKIISIKNLPKHHQYLENQITNVLCKYLISKCINYNPKERSTAEEIIGMFFKFALCQLELNETNFFSYIILNNNPNALNIFITMLFTKVDKEHLKYINKSDFLLEIIDYASQVVKNQKIVHQIIRLLEILSNKNDFYAQYALGIIYLSGKNIAQDINKGINYLELSARNNNPKAQMCLGINFLDGSYVKKNFNKGIHYLTLAANNNDLLAQYFLGIIYFYGIYIQEDYKKGIYYLILSANNNYSEAQYSLGMIYLNGENIQKDITKGINYIKLSANSNNSKAQFTLGKFYYLGENVEKDIDKGIQYFTLSANGNNPDAQFLLGAMYFYGINIHQNINKGIYYLILSAYNNNSDAQYCLASIYLNGINIPKDKNKGIHYLILSANNNNSNSQYYLGIYYFNENNINKGIQYLTLSATNNNYEAQFLLGRIYFIGKNIPKNVNKGICYLTLSANNDYSDAQFFLGSEYFNGKNIPQDINKGIQYITNAANNNNALAQYLLGIIYFYGKKVTQDINKGIRYITLAADSNNELAQFSLGLFYFLGKNIEQNINKGLKYFFMSADKNNSDANFFLGLIYFYGIEMQQDINKGLNHLRLSANQNHELSSKELGLIYLTDEYVSKDISKAIQYLKKSASQSNISSNLYLGIIYYSRKYLERDIQQAIYYFKEASSFNNQYAKNNLAIIYKNGEGVKKNIGKVIEYLEEGIRQNKDDFCLYNLSRIYYFGIEEVNIQKDINKVILLLEKSLKNNFSPSIFFLYLIYSFGEEEIKDIHKSKYYEQYMLFSDYSDAFKMIISQIDYISKEIIFEFIKNYDLIYSYVSREMDNYDEIDDFYKSLMNRIFPNLDENKNISKKEIMTQQKDINELFYEGFDIQ